MPQGSSSYLDSLSFELQEDLLTEFPDLEEAPGKIVYPNQYSGTIPKWSYQGFPPDEEEARAIFDDLDEFLGTWLRLRKLTRDKPFGGQYYTCWKIPGLLLLLTNPYFELGPIRVSWIPKGLNARYISIFL